LLLFFRTQIVLLIVPCDSVFERKFTLPSAHFDSKVIISTHHTFPALADVVRMLGHERVLCTGTSRNHGAKQLEKSEFGLAASPRQSQVSLSE
jgi:hypothetical protein